MGRRERSPKQPSLQSSLLEARMFNPGYLCFLLYENIIEVIEDFSAKHCVGEGGYGYVYRASFPNGQVVAVKKLHTSFDGELVDPKSFTSEINALTKIRHRNIVKLYGYCSHPRHSFLVYEFLQGGSLGNVLCSEEQAVEFDWIKRVNVVKVVADALSYMHHSCSPPIIHRDISNEEINRDYVQLPKNKKLVQVNLDGAVIVADGGGKGATAVAVPNLDCNLICQCLFVSTYGKTVVNPLSIKSRSVDIFPPPEAILDCLAFEFNKEGGVPSRIVG